MQDILKLHPEFHGDGQQARNFNNALVVQSADELKFYLVQEKDMNNPDNPLHKKFNELIELSKATGFFKGDLNRFPVVVVSNGSSMRFTDGYVYFNSDKFLNRASIVGDRLRDYIEIHENKSGANAVAQKLVKAYKIHLMPKNWQKTKKIVEEFLKLLVADKELQKNVGLFKVRLAPVVILGEVLPTIVIYVYTGKEDAQKVLNAIYNMLESCADCKDGLGIPASL